VPVAQAAARLVVVAGGDGGGGGSGGGEDGALALAADRAAGAGGGDAPPAAGPAAAATTPAEAADEAAALVRCIERAVHDLAVGPATTPAARRALLPRLDDLVRLLGRREANDFLLPLAITFLNDRDWRLRAAFFQHAGGLACDAGPAGLEAFLLPCLEQALSDGEPAVVAAAIGFLADAAGGGGGHGGGGGSCGAGPPPSSCLLRKRALLAAARRVLPRLLEPAEPAVVRAAAARFAAAAARALSPGEAHSLLGPLLAPALARAPGAVGSSRQVGRVAAFLLSDAASWVTGQVIAVDGGQNL
jgi:phosphoinositide-3-kinase regulatory subunit 4